MPKVKFDTRPLDKLLNAKKLDKAKFKEFISGVTQAGILDDRFISIGNESFTLLGYAAYLENLQALQMVLASNANPNILTQGPRGIKEWNVLGNVLSWKGERKAIPYKKIGEALDALREKQLNMDHLYCKLQLMDIAAKATTVVAALEHGVSPDTAFSSRDTKAAVKDALDQLSVKTSTGAIFSALHPDTARMIEARLTTQKPQDPAIERATMAAEAYQGLEFHTPESQADDMTAPSSQEFKPPLPSQSPSHTYNDTVEPPAQQQVGGDLDTEEEGAEGYPQAQKPETEGASSLALVLEGNTNPPSVSDSQDVEAATSTIDSVSQTLHITTMSTDSTLTTEASIGNVPPPTEPIARDDAPALESGDGTEDEEEAGAAAAEDDDGDLLKSLTDFLEGCLVLDKDGEEELVHETLLATFDWPEEEEDQSANAANTTDVVKTASQDGDEDEWVAAEDVRALIGDMPQSLSQDERVMSGATNRAILELETGLE